MGPPLKMHENGVLWPRMSTEPVFGWHGVFTLCVLGAGFVAMHRGTAPPDFAMLGMLLALAMAGVVTINEALAG